MRDPIWLMVSFQKFSIQAFVMQLCTHNSKTSIIKNNVNFATFRLKTCALQKANTTVVVKENISMLSPWASLSTLMAWSILVTKIAIIRLAALCSRRNFWILLQLFPVKCWHSTSKNCAHYTNVTQINQILVLNGITSKYRNKLPLV